MPRRRLPRIALVLLSALLAATVGGCGSLFGRTAPEASPTEVRSAVPTFTSTPIPVEQVPIATATPAVVAEAAATPVPPTPTASTASTAPAEPRLIVSGELVNLRSGPGTEFGLIGTANQGQIFVPIARNPAGDWWQICCIGETSGWIFGALATTENVEAVAVAADLPTPPPTPAEVAAAPVEEPTTAPEPAPPASTDPSAGNFDPNAAYQIVDFRVLGLGENNGGIRDSRGQHLILVTVLDQNGNGLDGAVVRNLMGEKGEVVTGSKGPGRAELTMYWEPFKLTVASDPAGATTSHISNQMGLAFPHLPDIVGKLGGTDYEYAVCPTPEINCQWPIQLVHFSYEITFQKLN